ESTYGYSAAGAGTVSATARVNVQVTVPKLIMLRVGSDSTTVDTVAITLAPSTPAAPVDGNSQAFAWDGTAPTFTASAPAGLNAYAWSNTDATLTGSVTTTPGTTGLTAASITVASTGTLAHPGTDTGTFPA